MMCSCEKMIGPSSMGAMCRNELYDANIHEYQIVQFRIGHFTVMGGSEADGDLVLVQTFLLYYENQFILTLISIFQEQFP